ANLYGAILHGANLNGASLNSAILDGANLYGAILHGASLYGARLDRAILDRASLYGADLRNAVGLIREQIESAWINEWTKLPEDLEKVKPEILERQRLRRKQVEETSTPSPAPEVVGPEKQEEE